MNVKCRILNSLKRTILMSRMLHLYAWLHRNNPNYSTMEASLYWRVTGVPITTLILGEFNIFAISQCISWNLPCRLAPVYSSLKLLFYSSLVLKQLLLAKNKSFYCFYDNLYTKAYLLALKRIWYSGATSLIHHCTKLPYSHPRRLQSLVVTTWLKLPWFAVLLWF